MELAVLAAVVGGALLRRSRIVADSTPTPPPVPAHDTRFDGIRCLTRSYVDGGQFPCVLTAVLEDGELVYLDAHGKQDVAKGIPLTSNSIFRFYSMTKPITSTAVMMLYEQGRISSLDDPIGKYLKEFNAHPEVFVRMEGDRVITEAAERRTTIRDLLTHTGGLTYGLFGDSDVAQMYRAAGITHGFSERLSLKEMAEIVGKLPLVCHPGKGFEYSLSTDILGYLVQILSEQPFDDFLKEKIFGPLGMIDTDFYVPEEKLSRFCTSYRYATGHTYAPIEGDDFKLHAPKMLSGGGGLVSTAADYIAFMKFLLSDGTVNGSQILKRATLEEMTGSNHLPNDVDMAALATSAVAFSETTMRGVGFCLMGSHINDPAMVMGGGLCAKGEFGWGGLASTFFFVDRRRMRAGLLLTQLIPSSSYAVRGQFRTAVHAALD